MASSRKHVAETEQNVTFVELFFDLVFVFSVTQVVGLLHHGGLGAIVEALLAFWMIWWAWTQFTWTLNTANTVHSGVEVATLVATGAAFFMAIAVPAAFHGHELWFALCYVLVRCLGLLIYLWVSWHDRGNRDAVKGFALTSMPGMLFAVAGGWLGGAATYYCWSAVLLLDVYAAFRSDARGVWKIHAEHFSERHGLFTIIALGEMLIVAGSSIDEDSWSQPLLVLAALAVGLVCTLWWTYFTRAKPLLDLAFSKTEGRDRARFARDVFSLAHFPMLCGVVAFAFAIEEALAHPDHPLGTLASCSLALGVLLFVGGMALALRRATGHLPAKRLWIALVTAGAVMIPGLPSAATLAIAWAGALAVALVEQYSGCFRQALAETAS